VRAYSERTVSDGTLDALISAVQQSTSSINGQQTSLVVVRDVDRRKRVSEIPGGQPWITEVPVFITMVMDFHKTALAGEKRNCNS